MQSLNGKTFGVFGGHEAVDLGAEFELLRRSPRGDDVPTSTWGKQFAVARTVVQAVSCLFAGGLDLKPIVIE